MDLIQPSTDAPYQPKTKRAVPAGLLAYQARVRAEKARKTRVTKPKTTRKARKSTKRASKRSAVSTLATKQNAATRRVASKTGRFFL